MRHLRHLRQKIGPFGFFATTVFEPMQTRMRHEAQHTQSPTWNMASRACNGRALDVHSLVDLQPRAFLDNKDSLDNKGEFLKARGTGGFLAETTSDIRCNRKAKIMFDFTLDATEKEGCSVETVAKKGSDGSTKENKTTRESNNHQ